jgi:hypothetical protein
MSDIEWVSLYFAVARLEDHWGIPSFIAQQIVRNVVEGGRAEVRAVQRYQLVPKIVTGRIRLTRDHLFSEEDFKQIEIDWNGLLVNGYSLLPNEYFMVPNDRSIVTCNFRNAPDPKIINAIRQVYNDARLAGQKPPNIKEIIKPVQLALQSEGLAASGKRIQELASDGEFKKLRRKPGATVTSERRRQHP